MDGAFAGKPELVESEFAKAMVAGTYPGVIISAAAAPGGMAAQIGACGGRRHAGLDLARKRISAPAFLAQGAPSKSRCGISARRGWSAIIDQLGTAALDMRKQASLASAIAQRTLLSIAANAEAAGD